MQVLPHIREGQARVLASRRRGLSPRTQNRITIAALQLLALAAAFWGAVAQGWIDSPYFLAGIQ